MQAIGSMVTWPYNQTTMGRETLIEMIMWSNGIAGWADLYPVESLVRTHTAGHDRMMLIDACYAGLLCSCYFCMVCLQFLPLLLAACSGTAALASWSQASTRLWSAGRASLMVIHR